MELKQENEEEIYNTTFDKKEHSNVMEPIAGEVIKIDKQNSKITLNCSLAIFASLLAALCLGATLGYSSPAGPKLMSKTFNHQLVISDQDKSWFDGIVSIGAMCGGCLAGTIAAVIGFKKSIILCSLLYMFGWMLVCYASAIYVLYIGRFSTGFAAGMTTFLAPVYNAELAPPHIRGSLGSSFQLAVISGILISYIEGAFLSWEWLAAVSSIFPLILFIQMFFMPEVPRWLLSQNRKADSMKALLWLRGKDASIEEELWKIELSMCQGKKISLKEFRQQFRQPQIYKPVLIILPLMMLQQFSGFNAVTFNTVELFKTALPDMDPNLASILVVIAQLFICIPAIFLIDRLGRRVILLTSTSVMTISCITFGLYYIPQMYNKPSFTWLPLISLAIYVMAFSFGFGPIPLLIMAEIIPNNIRSIASGLSLLVNWTSSFIVTTEFLNLKNALTSSGVFWLFAACSLLSTIFIWVFIPETKGKSLEDITKLFMHKSKQATANESKIYIEIKEPTASYA